ncbi:hypothetical protein BN946_scf184766.g32 [Trametes cinnabarina]|uniref:HMA domain-containing protein n=1 Tax=Pycnoporus cinnabarinus TaxID=5643 RepID=A0A060S5T9_PYCCI|nr:hypothetical protein BN946_scf184766.g32 [Trametes cinnabarina]
MAACCSDCGSDSDVQSIKNQVDVKLGEQDTSQNTEPGCCEGSNCGCDARVICADDDSHLHSDQQLQSEHTAAQGNRGGEASKDSDAQFSSSDYTCCEKDSTAAAEKGQTSLPVFVPTKSCGHAGFHEAAANDTQSGPAYPKQACGEHRYIARSRYNETLSAFGCVCKALLARGMKSCCSSPLGRSGKAAARPSSGRQSARLSSDKNGRADEDGAKHEHVAIDIQEDLTGRAREHAVLAIKGMTCTGCENKLIRTLKGISTIFNVKTSLVLCRAEFDFDNSATDLASLVAIIEMRSGFSAEVVKTESTQDLSLMVSPSLLDKMLSLPYPAGVERMTRSGKGRVALVYDPMVIGARNVLDFYQAFSPTLAPDAQDPAITAGTAHIRSLVLRTALSIVLTIPVLVMTWAPLPPHPRAYAIASLVLATIVQTVITGPFYVSSFKSLAFSRLVETELLIVLSTTTAYIYSVVAFAFEMLGRPLATGQFFETSTLLVTLIMVGQVVSAVARQRAIEAISIRSLQERNARIVLPDGHEQDIDARLLHYDDQFKVLPDSVIITDGLVISGTSTVDESMMTGESRPVEKAAGSLVIAGTHNGSSTLIVKVIRLPGENTISDIANMVDDARFSRAKVQEAVDWICGWFVPVVLMLAIITFVVWLAVGIAVRKQPSGEAAVTALTYAISVLAISCPCAIGLAVPMVILIAGGVGAKLGLIFKAATTIEQARKVTHVVLDKTGTVTQGRLSVVSRFVDDSVGFNVSVVVSALVASSRHPVSQAVSACFDADSSADTDANVGNVEVVVGKGVQGTLLGQSLRGGSAAWLGIESHPVIQPLLSQGLTTFCVVHGDRVIAAFGLSDTIRPEAHSVLNSLAARNIRVSMLSGDHPSAVYRAAAELGIAADRVRASCLPADKQAYIKELAAQGETVLFCGDGTNDAIALAQAAIGVHLHTDGASGVAASTAADVVLTHPSLTGILTLLELSDAVARRIALNFAWSFVYNLVAILLAAGAFVHARVPPAYAGLGEIVSVLPVVLVAVQLKWFKPSV